MTRKTRTLVSLAIFILASATFSAAQYQAWRWTFSGGLQNLGTLQGDDFAQAFAINSLGEIVGGSGATPNETAFRWTPQGGMQPLLHGGNWTYATGVNSSGTVSGVMVLNSTVHAVYWREDGILVKLGSLGVKQNWSQANAINGSGEIVGQTPVPLTTQGHGFLWTTVNGMQDLGTLNGNNVESNATAINDNGAIVGWSGTKTNTQHAVVWKDSVIKDLGTLPGGSSSGANGINNAGLIVGYSDSSMGHGYSHAVLWFPDGTIEDLGTGLGGYSYALGINNSNQVTGYYETVYGFVHPFIWTQAGGIQDLGALHGFPNGFGVAINDAGVVTGSSTPNLDGIFGVRR